MRRFGIGSVLVLAVSIGAVTSARAETLQQLIDTGGSIVQDNLKFSQFSYLGSGDMPTASNINVVPIVDASGNFGIRFVGGFIDLSGGGASNALISFAVSMVDPSLHSIGAANLSGNPIVTGDGGFIGVTETFLPMTESMEIHAQDGSSKFSDSTTFETPPKSLFVQKGIIGFGGNSGAATLSLIDQTFVQVPEPISVALLLSGTLGAVFITRRMRSSSSL